MRRSREHDPDEAASSGGAHKAVAHDASAYEADSDERDASPSADMDELTVDIHARAEPEASPQPAGLVAAGVASEDERLPNEPPRPSAQADSDLDLIRLWLAEKAAHTRRAYERDLEEFVERVDKPLQAVTLDDVHDHKRHLVDKGLATSTVSRKVACIKSLFTFAHKIGYVAFNVGQAVRQPTPRRRLNEKLLSHSEVHQLFATARETQHPLRNLAILRLFYASGVRRSELAELQWRDAAGRPDLTPPRGQITVFGKGEKERTIIVTAGTWEVLRRLRTAEMTEGRGGPDHPVFWSRQGGALSENAIYRVVKKAAAAAGISGKKVSPHSFRHAHITHALQNGASLHVVMDTVGHSSMQVTSAYSHARPSESSSDYIND